MIAHASPVGLLLLGGLAVMATVLTGWAAGRRVTEYAAFTTLDATDSRCRTYRRWF